MPVDADVRLLAECSGECRERALQPEVFERLGPELPGDSADVLGALAGRLAQLVELGPEVIRDPRGEAFDLEHHAGQRLADLVVELARDPASLTLLDEQRAPCAVAPLELEPVEHLVERLRERRHDGTTLDLHAPAR